MGFLHGACLHSGRPVGKLLVLLPLLPSLHSMWSHNCKSHGEGRGGGGGGRSNKTPSSSTGILEVNYIKCVNSNTPCRPVTTQSLQTHIFHSSCAPSGRCYTSCLESKYSASWSEVKISPLCIQVSSSRRCQWFIKYTFLRSLNCKARLHTCPCEQAQHQGFLLPWNI